MSSPTVGHVSAEPEIGAASNALAIFDLDGTLVTRDSFLPFLISYAIKRRRFWPVIVMPVWIGLYVLRLISARTVKERLLTLIFNSEKKENIAQHAETFCRNWVDGHLRPDLMEKLREHQKAGHRIILLSASPDIYVPRIGKHLGIDETVCTRVAWNEGCCTGKIVGPNCKGEEKVTLLGEYLQVKRLPDTSYAYGDSKSDLPILRWATYGYLVRNGALQAVSKEMK
ncbi:MAG TPA: HAD family hydrolase [Gemmataceae bacterium]|jgi:phosphatidylglycerophosphatase C|nr:HAD family hydrolase [Gemmataceae bacterium]